MGAVSSRWAIASITKASSGWLSAARPAASTSFRALTSEVSKKFWEKQPFTTRTESTLQCSRPKHDELCDVVLSRRAPWLWHHKASVAEASKHVGFCWSSGVGCVGSLGSRVLYTSERATSLIATGPLRGKLWATTKADHCQRSLP